MRLARKGRRGFRVILGQVALKDHRAARVFRERKESQERKVHLARKAVRETRET
jgi:hypothetical protein